MRRFPVYLVLDSSGSMNGEAIHALNNGLDVLRQALVSDPHSLEVAFLSIISFNNDAKLVLPLTSVAEISPYDIPTITASGCTYFYNALKLLKDCLDSNIVKSSKGVKGDYRPLIFFMSDGEPSDTNSDWKQLVAKIRTENRPSDIIAIACGSSASVENLNYISMSPNPQEAKTILMQNVNSNTFSELFKFISTSISSGSCAVSSPSINNDPRELLAGAPDIIVLNNSEGTSAGNNIGDADLI